MYLPVSSNEQVYPPVPHAPDPVVPSPLIVPAIIVGNISVVPPPLD